MRLGYDLRCWLRMLCNVDLRGIKLTDYTRQLGCLVSLTVAGLRTAERRRKRRPPPKGAGACPCWRPFNRYRLCGRKDGGEIWSFLSSTSAPLFRELLSFGAYILLGFFRSTLLLGNDRIDGMQFDSTSALAPVGLNTIPPVNQEEHG